VWGVGCDRRPGRRANHVGSHVHDQNTLYRCRTNMAHIGRQSRPDSSPRFHVKCLETFYVVASLLESGSNDHRDERAFERMYRPGSRHGRAARRGESTRDPPRVRNVTNPPQILATGYCTCTCSFYNNSPRGVGEWTWMESTATV